MNRPEIHRAVHEDMQAVRVSPALRRRTLEAMRGKEVIQVKKKISMALVFALVAILLCTAALAAANRAGLLDSLSGIPRTFLPADASDYVESDVASFSQEDVHVNIRELFYDGRTARIVLDIVPHHSGALLLAPDSAVQDSWQNLITLPGEAVDEADTRTILDVYQEEENGYTSMFLVSVGTQDEADGSGSGWREFVLEEDGTLVCFIEETFQQDQPERDVTLTVFLTPYDDAAAQFDEQSCRRASMPLSLVSSAQETPDAAQASVPEDCFVSTEAVLYEDIGVRVDRVLMTVKPLEIYYSIEYTVVDREAYALTDDGLLFEFIDPDAPAEKEPWEQRLAEGPGGGEGAFPLDGDLDTAVHYRQEGTLALDEQADRYLLRAYDCWSKQRFDTHTFSMRPAAKQDTASSF